jgi:alcohol dehydrogenase class IV
MENLSFNIPAELKLGYGESKNLAEYAAEMQLENIVLVVDDILLELGLIDQLLDNLKQNNIGFTLYNKIKREPTVEDIDSAVEELNINDNYDGVVGIGGGSVMDTAKILSVSSQFEGSVSNYIGTDLIAEKGLPMIMIPSTAGTGSEATPNAIVKDTKAESKKGIVSKYLIPDLVILDPALTVTLPANITAETGMDAFTHAIECYTSNKSNYLSDIFALRSIELISQNIRRAVSDGEDKEARYNMILGSYFGGVAITNSGTGGVHALSYPLGGKYGIAHGLSNSILLADVMAFNAEAVPEKFVTVSEYMGLDTEGLSTQEIVDKVVAEIRSIIADVGIGIDDFELTDEIIEYLAENAMEVTRLLDNNPREITYQDAVNIYKSSL